MNAVATQMQTAGDSAFNLAQRQALAMCNSSLVPAPYRGRENLGNVLIAMQLANRIGADPMAVMQNLHVIQGKPSLSSSFLIATVNACGRFEPLRFEIVGTDPDKDDYKVRAFAADKKSGDPCYGTWITWKMVKAEGWSKKPGSKWLTMPEQMFQYRAAAFWARLFAPEVSLGIHTVEEVQDVWGTANIVPNAPTDTSNLKRLEADLRGEPLPEITHCDDIPTVDAQAVHDRLLAAEDVDALNEAAADINLVSGDEAKTSLTDLYADRFKELSQ